jgi:hypothetical protein
MTMKKLSLDIDTLQVESFLTTSHEPGRGTVQGRATGSPAESCLSCFWTCEAQMSCDSDCATNRSCLATGCAETGYTACEACTTYGNPGGGDACMQTIESDCRTQTAC